MVNEKIKEQVLELSKKERAALAHLLIESLQSEEKYKSEEAWAEELKKRIDQYESGEGSSKPWEEVKRNAQTMLNQ